MKYVKIISYFNKVFCIVNCISILVRCERFIVGFSVCLIYCLVLQCYIGFGYVFFGGEEEEFSMEQYREFCIDFVLFFCKIVVKFKNICDREESIMKVFFFK